MYENKNQAPSEIISLHLIWSDKMQQLLGAIQVHWKRFGFVFCSGAGGTGVMGNGVTCPAPFLPIQERDEEDTRRLKEGVSDRHPLL